MPKTIIAPHSTDGQDEARIQVGVTGSEHNIHDSLSVGAECVTIYRHEGLTPAQVLDRPLKHYVARAMNRPGGRR